MNQRKRKLRVPFRKNRQHRQRKTDWTREVQVGDERAEQVDSSERLTGKGDLTRYRTIIADGEQPLREVDDLRCLPGLVIQYIGAQDCRVQTEEGRIRRCSVRQVVRQVSRSQRNAVVAGDRVWLLPLNEEEGVVERVDPRTSTLSRCHDRREHIIAANVDQSVIVTSVAQPPLKPPLIDRFIVSSLAGHVTPIICINKWDLRCTLDDASRQELDEVVDLYRGLGYLTLPCSATDGQGIAELKTLLPGKVTAFAGQSGVGKSSLLNAVQPGLGRPVSEVSDETGKGRHTTRVAELIPLDAGEEGGWVVDTPGIRQFQLWNIAPGELEAYFVEFLPHIPHCRFPNCSHTHEEGCAVKQAVLQGTISPIRYQSYVRILLDD